MGRLALTFLLLIPVLPVSLRGQTCLSRSGSDSVISIRGAVGADSVVVIRVRLVATGTGPAAIPFALLPSDLVSTAPAHDVVSGSKIELLANPTPLPIGLPTAVDIKVPFPRKSAIYRGSFTFRIQSAQHCGRLTIPVTADVRAEATLIPRDGTDTVRLKVVNCTRLCWLSELFLPQSAFANEAQVVLENPGGDDLAVSGTINVASHGEQSDFQLTNAMVRLSDSTSAIPGHQIASRLIRIERGSIPPDRYSGTLYLALRPTGRVIPMRLRLDVRASAWKAALCLLIGIVIGRVVKYMNDQGNAQSDALAAVYRVEARVKRSNPDDAKLLSPMVSAIREAVYESDLTTVTDDLKAVSRRLKLLMELRQLETGHTPSDEAFAKEASGIRALVGAGRDADAQARLTALKTPSAPPAPPRDLTSLAQPLRRTLTSSRTWPIVVQLTEVIAGGVEPFRAEVTLRVLRPALQVALLVGLLAVGMNTLYVQGSTTFGSSPFGDYLGLILWGLSADVANRKLTSLVTKT